MSDIVEPCLHHRRNGPPTFEIAGKGRVRTAVAETKLEKSQEMLHEGRWVESAIVGSIRLCPDLFRNISP